MDIRDKGVIIAGGSGSLGSAIAESLAARGARVAVLDVREPAEPLDAIALSLRADLADEDAIVGALDLVYAEFGKVHVLVNCAGLIHSESLVNMSNPERRRHATQTWHSVIRSNLTATFLLSAQVAERMALSRTKGVIVNFSSIAARGNAGQTAYAAAKAGVEAMTTVWARELGPLGIRAVAIAPGFVSTPSTEAALAETTLADIKRRTPLMRLAKAAEIASTVAFAVENDFITGTTLAVDGGFIL